LADGSTIQESSAIALKNGITLDQIFDDLKKIKNSITTEVYLMGYYNQWLNYGLEKFCQRAADSGIHGFIIPDLPMAYYDEIHQKLLEKYKLKICFLITPDSDDSRIKQADKLSTGFVYVVSSNATTGKTNSVFASNREYFEKIRDYPFVNRCMLGFGIHDNAGFEKACQYADGAIVGSAFIRHLKNNFSKRHIQNFIHSIKNKA
jgi:tryptophan synthase alpha chain